MFVESFLLLPLPLTLDKQSATYTATLKVDEDDDDDDDDDPLELGAPRHWHCRMNCLQPSQFATQLDFGGQTPTGLALVKDRP